MDIGFSSIRALIVGDVILDRYISGRASRLSPEAPVPVLRQVSRHATPGGAANVACNIVGMGGKATVVGVVGTDRSAAELEDLLGSAGVLSLLIKDTSRPTISKTRLLAEQHQMIRLDEEETDAVSEVVAQALFETVQRELPNAQVLILSDYAKGTLPDALCQKIIELAARYAVPTFVDPKRQNWSVFTGATMITPNRAELTLATGLPCETDDQAQAAANAAHARTGSNILLTRSERGMSYFAEGQEAIHIATAAREVFDVSGAGDTVMAALALGFGSGLPIERVMRTANLAAAIAVGKVGTAIVSSEELAEAFSATAHSGRKFRVSHVAHEQALAMRESWRGRGLKVGLANGCFDILHPGHVTLIAEAAQACDRLIIALNTDASVRRLKGTSRPIQTEEARAQVMAMIKGVDLVVLFDEDTPEDLIRRLSPDVLFKGTDYEVHQIAGAAHVIKNGGRVELIDLVAGHSTTSIVNLVTEGR